MKTITFKYTKKDGKTSERTLLVQVAPSDVDFYAGIDLTSIDVREGAAFVTAMEDLQKAYFAKIDALKSEFDLTHNYRKFLIEGMSDIVEL